MKLFGRPQSAAKAHHRGTHRTRSPAETLDAYMPLMDTGGITRLANITGLDLVGIPVYAAIRPLSRSLSIAQGKGLDDAAARASALMESLEAWHAEHVSLPVRYETMRALARNANVLDPSAIPPRRTAVFDPDRPTFWVEGWELFLEEPVWVPFELVHLNFVRPAVPWTLYTQASNGLASGNCLLEASVHALCELIERDATSLWFLNPLEGSDQATQLDLTSVDGVNRALLERIDAADLLVGAFDTTSDVGVPSYQAVLLDRPGSPRAMGYFWGFGCHLDPSIALARAITEAAQCRLTEITGAREDIAPEDFLANRDDDELAAMQEDLFARPPPRRLHDRRSLATESLEGDLAALRDALRRAGVTRGALVDLSRPELGLPVVRAIVPELEPPFSGPEHRPGPRGRRIRGGESGGVAHGVTGAR